jgi:hypothetical protein
MMWATEYKSQSGTISQKKGRLELLGPAARQRPDASCWLQTKLTIDGAQGRRLGVKGRRGGFTVAIKGELVRPAIHLARENPNSHGD